MNRSYRIPCTSSKSASRTRTTCRAAGPSVNIRFAIPYRVHFGQHLRVIGGCEILGNWNLERALPMIWSDGDIWTAEVQLPADKELSVEYKYVVCEDNGTDAGAAWKPGSNFTISLPGGGSGSIKVKDAWDEGSREVQIETIKNVARRKTSTSIDGSSSTNSSIGGGGDSSSFAEGGGGGGGGGAVAALSSAADSALEQLEMAVEMSLELMESSSDVASVELLAADRLVAAAAQKASIMTKAFDVAASPTRLR